MEQQLMEAAREGNISDLYALIRKEDQVVLEKMDKILFVETPLHVAASQGQTHFALEMMELKPSFTRKWNQDRFTPIHLAVKSGQTETALRLLTLSAQGDDNGDIVRVKGQGGLTPLHCAAEQGNIELLLVFLSVCPKSMEDVTIRNETCLHLVLKNNQLEAFKALIGWIELGCEEGAFWEERLLNSKDDQGNTILDLATSRQELIQVVSLLANSRLSKYVDVLSVGISPAKISEHPVSFLTGYTHLLRTEKRLNKAAYDGDTDALYEVLKEDRYVLDRIDQVPFMDTPLHIAASAGKTRFAREIMKLKPSFTTKLNQEGFSPLHLAVKSKSPTAVDLVKMNKELVSVKGKDDMTPLHCAAQMGNIKLLDEFLKASPESIDDLTVRKETVFHVAVGHDRLDSLKFLYQWSSNSGDLGNLSWIDDEDKTPRDIAEDQRSNLEILEFLQKMGAPRKGKKIRCSLYTLNDLILILKGRFFLPVVKQGLRASPEEINMIMVVCTLVATTSFQANVTPPRGDRLYSIFSGKTRKESLTGHGNKTTLKYILWGSFLGINTGTFYSTMIIMLSFLPRSLVFARRTLVLLAIGYLLALLCSMYG